MGVSEISLMSLRGKVVATLALALLALGGNYLSLPLFFGISFIFGSIMVMLAVRFLGTLPAVLVAITGGLYTLVLWGHPYALVTFTLEAAAVGLLYRRGLRNLVLADLVFWLVLGAPLVLVFYRGTMGMEWETTILITLKQPLNGLFNALLAGLIILSMQLYWRAGDRNVLGTATLPSLLFHVLLTTILVAGSVPIIIQGDNQRLQLEAFMAERLSERASDVATRLRVEPPEQWGERLITGRQIDGIGVALRGPNGEILLRQGEVASLSERPGRLHSLENGLSIWLPAGDMPAMPRWEQGRYQISLPVGGQEGVAEVVMEQSATPLVQTLEQGSVSMFTFLAGLLAFGILIARILSHRLTRPLSKLERISRDLSTQISQGIKPQLPDSAIAEYDGLGKSLREMSGLLAGRVRELRDFNAALFSSAGAIMAVLDREGRIVRFNQAAEIATGYSAEELDGKLGWECLAPPEDRAAVEAVFQQLTPGSVPGRHESQWVMRDGTRRLYDWSNAELRDEQGEVEFIVTIGVDITARKRAERALREQATHTQTILDNMVDGLFTINADGIIQSANHAATRIFGYDAEELLGHNVSMLMPSPHREAHDSYLRNYQSTGVARIIGTDREVEGQRKDGSLFPMELAVSEITQHEQPMYVGMVRDISERKRMERMKSEFVSTVSHELRTPLTSISGALGLVVGGGLGELPEQVRQMISIAQNNSLRLTHLINDLLDIEKISAGKLQFDMKVEPLIPLIEQALESHRTFGGKRNVVLSLDSESKDTDVRVDSQRLQQVLANLLSNAIKFSPEGGAVNISVQQVAGQARVTVTDQGPGIPEAFQSRIFEKFSQADSSDTRQKGGTGLGLAITRELVEHMGGRVGFESVEGQGATFWFELPLIDKSRFDPDTMSEDPVQLSAPRILVVEDEPDVAEVLGMLFTRSGYRIDIAHTGQKALEALAENRYDAVSLDLMLPDISGMDIIRHLRQQPETADLPIMVLSAKMEEGRLAINGDFSGIEWLAKPIDEWLLLDSLERLLDSSEQPKVRVLHVEDDSDVHQVIRAMAGNRFDFEQEISVRRARERIALECFDVIVLDITLPDGSGWDLLPEIRARQPEARVLVLSGTELTADEAHKVESVLLKSQVSPSDLLEALNKRIHYRYAKHQA
ncbi:PAS domain S-box protein [Marinobacter alexandrii]|uniref:PAS domain S-box protein n=1 Tax=Marinobacter alexandrii TaxID=2570351 RepID=UPI001FFE41B3|nr:PAS domain S-box protein [Marinobacter alexandrii]MCK2148102.1 PAS domain S-box protein [Marinobacter alexandrii]